MYTPAFDVSLPLLLLLFVFAALDSVIFTLEFDVIVVVDDDDDDDDNDDDDVHVCINLAANTHVAGIIGKMNRVWYPPPDMPINVNAIKNEQGQDIHTSTSLLQPYNT